MLGPVHRVPVRGLALPGTDAFATPLGTVPIDRDALRAVQDLPQVVKSDPAHALEHSLEVQLPFLQKVLGEFAIVPFAVGMANCGRGRSGDRAPLGRPRDADRDLDRSVALPCLRRSPQDRMAPPWIALLPFSTDIDHEEACGATPLNGLLSVPEKETCRSSCSPRAIRAHGRRKGQVVGYSSFAPLRRRRGEA